MFAFGYAPQGWATCDGQMLPISQYQALFAVLGTAFGGDGSNTFGLPDLRGRVPLHVGSLNGGGLTVDLGQVGGEEGHALTAAEMADHTHAVSASPDPADAPGATDN